MEKNNYANEAAQREFNFREQREYKGDLKALFGTVSEDYDLGKVSNSEKVEIGYEDDNHILETEKGKFFVKIFGGYRDVVECKRYVDIIEKSLEAGVSHPKMFQSENGPLYSNEDLGVNLAVFEFIEGQNFYEMGRMPTKEETKAIAEQAAKINAIDFKPSHFVYDEWAITSIVEQYEKVEHFLSNTERETISSLVSKYKELDLNSLPHSLVHGDITTTNTMISKDGKIYILDFAVANYYPRIMELAVPLCNLLWDQDYNFVIGEYQKHLKLTEEELEQLPLFVDLAHALHVVGATRKREIYGNNNAENEYWLEQGREGLWVKS